VTLSGVTHSLSYFYWPSAEPLADARGTLGFSGTPVENHCPKCKIIRLNRW